MVIESRERGTGGDRKSVDGAVKVSMLNLVDLAGSERIAHTGMSFILSNSNQLIIFRYNRLI